MAHDTFHAGDLTAIIGDNEAHGEHRAGYNGVHGLTHRAESTPLFVPAFAGLNFEHVFGGDQEFDDRRIFFEPRNAPMEFKRLSDNEAELYQPPTPTFFLESWTRFKLVAPHYIDFTFRCRPTQHAFRNGYIGLFWASYINAPDDKSMYFRGANQWQQLCSPEHNRDSTVRHGDDKIELKFRAGSPDTLFKSLSPLRYDLPLFYGLFRGQLFLMMFDRAEGVRLSHSPSGGGLNTDLQTSNPAWDFQFIIPRYEVLQDYSFRARAVYRPRCSRKEVLADYDSWRK